MVDILLSQIVHVSQWSPQKRELSCLLPFQVVFPFVHQINSQSQRCQCSVRLPQSLPHCSSCSLTTQEEKRDRTFWKCNLFLLVFGLLECLVVDHHIWSPSLPAVLTRALDGWPEPVGLESTLVGLPPLLWHCASLCVPVGTCQQGVEMMHHINVLSHQLCYFVYIYYNNGLKPLRGSILGLPLAVDSGALVTMELTSP